MYVIACLATKGGTGKTTLCAHLAVEAGRQGDGPVAVIDADPQASLAKWWNAREAEMPSFVQATIRNLPAQLKAMQETYRVAIIDTPGADVSHTRRIIRHADLVLIPSRPSPIDLNTLDTTIAMVGEEKRSMMFVLNAVTPRTRISTQAIQVLSMHGAVGGVIHQRTDYAAAMTDGRVASELDPFSRSSEEMTNLWKNVIKFLRKDARKL